VETGRISELLQLFLVQKLSEMQLGHISTYIDILGRWNQRMNLTAVRDPEAMVTRHFGESLFAAQHLFPVTDGTGPGPLSKQLPAHVADVGSGAGFPGVPIKIWTPEVRLTLIESNQKKASFLREVVRQLGLAGVDVFTDRAESFPPGSAEVVTLRAVERFDSILPVAAALVAQGGRLAMLIGEDQVARAKAALPDFAFGENISVPLSRARVLEVGTRIG